LSNFSFYGLGSDRTLKKRTQSVTGMMPCFGYKPILKAHFCAVVLMNTISGQGEENTPYCK